MCGECWVSPSDRTHIHRFWEFVAAQSGLRAVGVACGEDGRVLDSAHFCLRSGDGEVFFLDSFTGVFMMLALLTSAWVSVWLVSGRSGVNGFVDSCGCSPFSSNTLGVGYSSLIFSLRLFISVSLSPFSFSIFTFPSHVLGFFPLFPQTFSKCPIFQHALHSWFFAGHFSWCPFMNGTFPHLKHASS